MREVKDTLGIKYDKYALLYNMDDREVGKLIKYLMWHFGKDCILENLTAVSKKKITEYSDKLEKDIEDMLDDFLFDKIFTEMTQQVTKSHKCWQNLKDNLEKNKGKNTAAVENQEVEPLWEPPCDPNMHVIDIFIEETGEIETIIVDEENKKNIPNGKELNDQFSYADIKYIIENGNGNGWVEHWSEYEPYPSIQ